jgi:hypothetical protein
MENIQIEIIDSPKTGYWLWVTSHEKKTAYPVQLTIEQAQKIILHSGLKPDADDNGIKPIIYK